MDERWLLAATRESAGDTALQSVTSVRELLRDAKHALANADASRDAEILLSQILSRTRAWLYAHVDDQVSSDDAARYRALVARRRDGEPIAYLIGHREFWSLDLLVTPDVLIPRSETELLVELALRHIPQSAKVDIADLGTGSGAIALTIASARADARVVAVDSSPAALDVARANARNLKIGNVEFRLSDWYADIGDGVFDIIVSNPPYVASGDAHLSQGDLRFEPNQALASGTDGLDDIRKIIAGCSTHLRVGGMLLIEHGFDQGAAVRYLLTRHGFNDVFTEQDVEARDRVSGGASRQT